MSDVDTIVARVLSQLQLQRDLFQDTALANRVRGIEETFFPKGSSVEQQAAASAGDFSQFALGIASIDGPGRTVTFNAGHLQHMDRTITIYGKTVTITGGSSANPVYAYVRYSYGAGAAIDTYTLSAYPQSDNDAMRIPLASFYITGGGAALKHVHHAGDIFVNAAMRA